MITQDRLKTQVSYDAETGLFTWLARRPGVSFGAECGRTNVHGYREIRIDRSLMLAHRLAFVWMTGHLPTGEVDHINGIKTDNRWENLRECDKSQNAANVGLRANNTSGFSGVVRDKDRTKWRAQIRVGGKKKNLGRFDTAEEAAAAVRAVAVGQWGEFAR